MNFPSAGDADRRESIQAALGKSPMDALICCTPTSVLLLTGYWPVMGNSVAVFTKDGEVSVVLPEDEAELAEKTSTAKIVAYKPAKLEELVSPIDELCKPLRGVLTDASIHGKNVGIELKEGMQPSSYAASVDFHTSLHELLKKMTLGANFVSCDSVLEPLKATKTAKELALMQVAAAIAADGFAEAENCIRAGVRETEVAAAVRSAFEVSKKAEGLHRSYGFFYCMSGPNSAKASAAFARTRQRVLEEGDLVMVHANTCADGYWTDITRTYTVGEPSERQRTMRTAIDEARKAALDAIRPGAAASAVDEAARSVMHAHGLGEAFRHSTGHGVGFAAANANGLPRIHPKSPDVLEEGMTFNVEPAAYFDGYGGMRHCDVVAVTADGPKVLTDF
jgi:Xaa-Pro aminopeptidase